MTKQRPSAPDRSYEIIGVDEEVSFSRVIGESEVYAFATLTGDWNPLHMDGQYAATTQFGERLAQPEDSARVVLFLATDESNYISGANLIVSGGQVVV